MENPVIAVRHPMTGQPALPFNPNEIQTKTSAQ
jgi:hypothetical protein